jgi:leucyl aminopeptidase
LRVLSASNFAPKNSLEFHWYAGEEGGLLGSQKIMHDYASRGVQVKALLNQDMTGYSPNNRLAVIQDYTSAPLNAFLQKCAKAYTDIPVVKTSCGYACSDHVSATRAGYRAIPFAAEIYIDR